MKPVDSTTPLIASAAHDAPLLAAARQWLAEGREALVVRVGATQGSVPRDTGTRMLVTIDKAVGTIGGGHLELSAIQFAREHLAAHRLDTWSWDVALGPGLGQCCGGRVRLHFEPLTEADIANWTAPAPLFDLQLYGAGHVGRAIVKLLADLPCRVWWIDEREAEFPPGPMPVHIEKVCVDGVATEVGAAPPGACYLVMTHSHALDADITEAVLRRGDFAYLGLIGSATKKGRLMHRCAAHGIAPELLQRLTCPIGLPGISGKSPELIAIATVAQLLQLQPKSADPACLTKDSNA